MVGGLLELSEETDCEYLDVDLSDEMNATTTHESIPKTVTKCADPNIDKTEAESIEQWKAKLMPHKILINQQKRQCIRRQQRAIQLLERRPVLMRTDMMTDKFTDPFKVEKGRLIERRTSTRLMSSRSTTVQEVFP